jgi:hypothetical protein
MRRFPLVATAALLALLMAATSPEARTQSDDEAWIERKLAERPLALRTGDGDVLAVADLPRFVGASVRLTLTNGNTRRGLLVAATANQVTLESTLGGGKARLDLPLASIVSAVLE